MLQIFVLYNNVGCLPAVKKLSEIRTMVLFNLFMNNYSDFFYVIQNMSLA